MARVLPKSTKRTPTRRAVPNRLGRRRLDALIEEATIDAYGESEQRTGFFMMLQEQLAIPFATEILGAPVRVERVDLDDTEEIVALCRRGRQRQKISILDLPLPSPPPVGWEWIAAYRQRARGWR